MRGNKPAKGDRRYDVREPPCWHHLFHSVHILSLAPLWWLARYSLSTPPSRRRAAWLHRYADVTTCQALSGLPQAPVTLLLGDNRYIVNTLDHAIGQLCSSKHFESRVNIPDASVKKLPSLARRLYRIFGHAYFQHREVFDKFESETSLCKRFHALTAKFDIMKKSNFDIPNDV